MNRVRAVLFQPFRLGIWLRFAFLAFFTGEMSNGGGVPSGNFGGSAPSQSGSSQGFAAAPFTWPPLEKVLPWILLAAVIFVVVYLLFLYVSSVLRFVLFEGVITGQPRIRQGWRRWKLHGNALFLWQLVFTLIMLGIYAIFFGLPVLAAWRAGVFRAPREHLLLLILGGTVLVGLAIIVILAGLLIWVLTKDFVVPMMAAEGISPMEGWRRLILALRAQKGSYAGYVGFKIVLAMAAGIIVAIISLALIVILVVPAVLIAVALGIFGAGGSIAWSAFTVTMLILFVVIAFALMITVMATLSVPIAVFFQSYALHFFAPRYEPLAAMMWPTPPPAEIG
ncbi:MAG TPA: hypothetical protein VD837_01625 [Terriglobales bacterium]|nr:hypothetical protein [Terriglobales bacterium]